VSATKTSIKNSVTAATIIAIVSLILFYFIVVLIDLDKLFRFITDKGVALKKKPKEPKKPQKSKRKKPIPAKKPQTLVYIP
jgi:hypothetical protein